MHTQIEQEREKVKVVNNGMQEQLEKDLISQNMLSLAQFREIVKEIGKWDIVRDREKITYYFNAIVNGGIR